MSKKSLHSSVAAAVIVLGVSPAPSRAQAAGPAIELGQTDIGGAVAGMNGLEADVWAIAESSDLLPQVPPNPLPQ